MKITQMEALRHLPIITKINTRPKRICLLERITKRGDLD